MRAPSEAARSATSRSEVTTITTRPDGSALHQVADNRVRQHPGRREEHPDAPGGRPGGGHRGAVEHRRHLGRGPGGERAQGANKAVALLGQRQLGEAGLGDVVSVDDEMCSRKARPRGQSRRVHRALGIRGHRGQSGGHHICRGRSAPDQIPFPAQSRGRALQGSQQEFEAAVRRRPPLAGRPAQSLDLPGSGVRPGGGGLRPLLPRRRLGVGTVPFAECLRHPGGGVRAIRLQLLLQFSNPNALFAQAQPQTVGFVGPFTHCRRPGSQLRGRTVQPARQRSDFLFELDNPCPGGTLARRLLNDGEQFAFVRKPQQVRPGRSADRVR